MTVESPNLLSIESRRFLLKSARSALEGALGNSVPPKCQTPDAALLQKCGVFVTLHKAGKLRGCIGYIVSDQSLYQTVAEVAVAAATRDPRFKRVMPEEMPEITLEISILTPLQRLHSIDEIQVGVHGLYITYKGQSGLLLPQVATEHGWDGTQFLQQTCKKAGLPDNAWQEPEVEIYRFSAQVFGE